jgi:hypothetical protein
MIFSKTLVTKCMKIHRDVDKNIGSKVDLNALNNYFYAFEILTKD